MRQFKPEMENFIYMIVNLNLVQLLANLIFN